MSDAPLALHKAMYISKLSIITKPYFNFPAGPHSQNGLIHNAILNKIIVTSTKTCTYMYLFHTSAMFAHRMTSTQDKVV